MTDTNNIIGIDLGGTNIRIGLVCNDKIQNIISSPTPAKSAEETVIQSICNLIENFLDQPVAAIGIGVPSVVDVERGIVYDVVNIPSWKEVHLKQILEKKYHIPVFINNDANCFVAGEKHFGKAKNASSVVGLVLGTGLGAGLILNNQLYEGKNCGAGEIGYLPYLQNNYEYYCSGQFFRDEYHISALEIFETALTGNKDSIEIFHQFGIHVGNMLMTVLYAYDPELILLGGSVSKSYALFKDSMHQELQKFIYAKTLKSLKIEVSEIENIAIYGAASLFYNNLSKNHL